MLGQPTQAAAEMNSPSTEQVDEGSHRARAREREMCSTSDDIAHEDAILPDSTTRDYSQSHPGSKHSMSSSNSSGEEDITVRELRDGDPELSGHAETIRPDDYEEPASDSADGASQNASTSACASEIEGDILETLQSLRMEASEHPERESNESGDRNHRWSAGNVKRSHSQSVGSDDGKVYDPDEVDGHGVGSSSRRLRRRMRGPGDRKSLI